MNKEAYDKMFRDYAFLDDYESVRIRPKNSHTYISNDTKYEKKYSESFLNNYPELKFEDQEKEKFEEIEQSRSKYNHTPYGDFVNRKIDMDKLDNKEYLYKNLDLPEDMKNNDEILENSDNRILNEALDRIKKLEFRYYAVLNKEFNLLNFKMVKCSMMCYDNSELFTVNEAKICAENCHSTIKKAKCFVDNLNENSRVKLKKCIDTAGEFNETNPEDKVIEFFKCYQGLSKDLVKMENNLKKEFSNYI